MTTFFDELSEDEEIAQRAPRGQFGARTRPAFADELRADLDASAAEARDRAGLERALFAGSEARRAANRTQAPALLDPDSTGKGRLIDALDAAPGADEQYPSYEQTADSDEERTRRIADTSARPNQRLQGILPYALQSSPVFVEEKAPRTRDQEAITKDNIAVGVNAVIY